MCILSLDDRIRKDLDDLYNGREMAGAISLNGSIIKNKIPSSFSPRLLPQHFTGDRNAKTVFVMLNPGYGIKDNNMDEVEIKKKECDDCLKKISDFNKCTLDCFINCYNCRLTNYGNFDFDRQDNFDLKQASFMKPWFNSGIDIPSCYLSNNYMRLVAKRNVLMQKLQLELVPYCSRTFDEFDSSKIALFFPFLETILEEIVREKRRYVIFGADKFKTLFKAYNQTHKEIFKISPKYKKKLTNKLTGSCMVIKVNYSGVKFKAIIANTFPNQALPNAYSLMEKYGEFCYDCFINCP